MESKARELMAVLLFAYDYSKKVLQVAELKLRVQTIKEINILVFENSSIYWPG